MKRWLPLAVLVAGCSPKPSGPVPSISVVVETRAEDGFDLERTQVDGPVRSVTVSGTKLVLAFAEARGANAVVRVPGACPLVVDPRARGGNRKLAPLFEIEGASPELGFDTPFELVIRPGCAEAHTSTATWEQVGGPRLRDVRTAENGRRFSARTATLEDLVGKDLPWGIVPLSPRTRGEVELEASLAVGSEKISRRVRLSAAARARGLPNVATGTRFFLGGEGWHVEAAPPNATAAVESTPGAPSLRPDRSGAWLLADAAGRSLRLVAGSYDATPLDCGRGDCHAPIAVTARASPMATILQRGLDGPFAGDYPACAFSCHAVGEPGISDGGFVAVASELGVGASELRRQGFHGMPAALRRLSGVGCLACHGPGAIPEASARYGILRADVCATCHDAPPRYGHVAAWRTSRMARADADPRVSTNEACARCHTTWGFLGHAERRPPPEVGPVGITCAACHSVHPPAADAAPAAGRCEEALSRRIDVPALLAGAVAPTAEKSRVCLSCHTPSPDDGAPAATAAAIWLARGGIDPRTGAALEGPSPDAALAGGCVGCHRDGPEELARGAGHAFRARRTRGADPALQARARALWGRLVAAHAAQGGTNGPAHAAAPRLDRKTPLGRAAWDVALVLEDPAADAHNPEYARRLLDAAEPVVAGGGPP